MIETKNETALRASVKWNHDNSKFVTRAAMTGLSIVNAASVDTTVNGSVIPISMMAGSACGVPENCSVQRSFFSHD